MAVVSNRYDDALVLSLDVGGSVDHSALALIRLKLEGPSNMPRAEHAVVMQLERLPLKHAYAELVSYVSGIMTRLSQQVPAYKTFIFDATGVGRPLIESFTTYMPSNVKIVPAVIVGASGRAVSSASEYGIVSVGKREIVSTLMYLITSGKIRFARNLKAFGELIEEVRNFKLYITETGHAQMRGTQDDLLMALGLGAWWSAVAYGLGRAVEVLPVEEKRPRFVTGARLRTESDI